MTFDIREFVLTKPVKTQKIATPFWSHVDENGVEQVNGFIALRDIPTNDLTAFQEIMMKMPLDGMCALMARCIIDSRTGNQIFPDTDRGALASLGFTEWMPLTEAVQDFFGLSQAALDAAIAEVKKNLTKTPS